MHLTRSVADDQGRPVVGLGLGNGLDGLSGIGTHGDLSHIDIAIAHGNLRQGLLLGLLAGSRELSDLTDVGSLGSLSAGVGVNLGIEDEDVHILVLSQHMVHAAEADIVCPAVAAEDPYGLLGQVGLLLQNLLDVVAADLGFQVGNQGLGGSLVGFAVVIGVQPGLAGSLPLLGSGVSHDSLDLILQGFPDNSLSGVHTQTMLCIVLEQGVGPGGTTAFFVDAVGRGGSGAAPDGGTAGGVGNVHPIAEQLSHQTGIAGLGTAGAGTGELQQGLAELRTLDGVVLHILLFLGLDQVVPNFLLRQLLLLRNHSDRLGGADADTDAAAHAVQRRHGHGVLVDALALASLHVHQTSASGSGSSLFSGQRIGTDGSMGADIGTVVALDALGFIPVRNGNGNAALLVSGSTQGELTVGQTLESGDRQAVAVHPADGMQDALDDVDGVGRAFQNGLGLIVLGGSPGSGHVDLHVGGSAGIDGVPVLLNHVPALLQVGVLSGVLHILDGVFCGHNLCQGEEGRLEDGVGTLAHANLDSQVNGIDGVKLNVVVCNVALGSGIQMMLQLLQSPLAVN